MLMRIKPNASMRMAVVIFAPAHPQLLSTLSPAITMGSMLCKAASRDVLTSEELELEVSSNSETDNNEDVQDVDNDWRCGSLCQAHSHPCCRLLGSHEHHYCHTCVVQWYLDRDDQRIRSRR